MESLRGGVEEMILEMLPSHYKLICRSVCKYWWTTIGRISIPPTKFCETLAINGHLGLLQWARANGCEWNTWTCARAAAGGHLEILQWARSNGCPWNEDTCAGAAMNGHLHVLQWARANGCTWDKNKCMESTHSHIVE